MMVKPSDIGGLFSYQRFVVVGGNGAGKTWVARRLADHLQLPLIHHDALALTIHWGRRPAAEVEKARTTMAARPAWILEGGPSALSDTVLKRAEVVIWLDLPRPLRFWRVLRRTLRYMGRNRPEHPPGNREWPGRRQWQFLRKVWTHDAAVRAAIAARRKQSDAHWIVLTRRRDVINWINAMERRDADLPALHSG